jgi:hypothetical protein
MSIRQLREWRAYYDLEPFGEERADYRAASIVATLVNLNRRRGTPPRPVTEFVLQFGEPKPKPKKDWRQLKAIGALIAGANQPQSKKPR